MKILVVISTGGAVLNELLKYPIIKNNIAMLLMDRKCEAIEVAKKNNIDYVIYEELNNYTFSNFVLDYALKNEIDYIYSFYLKLFKGELLNKYRLKIINFHPSILPAFSGFSPIKNAMYYGVKITGTTIHFIDNTIDQGLPILQTVTPVPDTISQIELTHKLFTHQCKSILQLTKWIVDKRLIIKNNKCYILNSKFETSEFYPNLDYNEAINFQKSL